MTIITYRGGIMASDSGCWVGDSSIPWASKLAFRTEDQSMHGVAGSAPECQAYLEWVMGERPEPPVPRQLDKYDSSYIVLIVREREQNTVEILTAYGTEKYRDVPYMAIGPASPCALGAMHAGATAVQAVQACIEHGSNATGKIRFLRGFCGARGEV